MLDYFEFDDARNIIQYLIDEGAAVLYGLDDQGEEIYTFDLDKVATLMPELHALMMEDIDQSLISLLERDLIEVEYDENLNASFKLSPLGEQAVRELGLDIPPSNEE